MVVEHGLHRRGAVELEDHQPSGASTVRIVVTLAPCTTRRQRSSSASKMSGRVLLVIAEAWRPRRKMSMKTSVARP
jgi:hypothetical protein